MFFKLVRSKTKFWQMLGRGTRLCPDLFGPGDDKTHFNVFDFCQNLEYFSQPLIPADSKGAVPLSEQIFKARLELIQQLTAIEELGDERAEIAGTLRASIASMNTDNFLVRPHAELVEKFGKPEAWDTVTLADLAALADRVAALPDQLDADDEDAKRFDVLLLNAQLSLLNGEPFERQRNKVIQIAGLLEDQPNIPAIAQQLELIQELQSDEWWVDVTYQMLEQVRKKLRLLVSLIERAKKGVVYSDFEDVIHEGTEVDLPGIGQSPPTSEFAQFRKKAQHFHKDQLDDPVVAKVRSGEMLTADDLAALRHLLESAGIGGDDDFAAATENAGSFGLFVRSLVGLDREAAKAAFAELLDETRYSQNQIQFVNLVINYLTEHGTVEAGRIYESPFTAVAPEGPEGLYGSSDVAKLFETIDSLVSTAA